MTSPPKPPSAAAKREASEWFARLRTPSISASMLADFERWRAEPGNNAAFGELEMVWSAGEGLRQDPDIRAAVRAAIPGRPRRSFIEAPPAWLGLAMAGAGAAFCLTLGVFSLSTPFGSESFQTGVGERRFVTLADGSQVRLDTNTQIRVRQTARSREVWLQSGQAFFDVIHDGRPFRVMAARSEIRAVGTRFDVRRDARSVSVILEQGVVTVRRTGPLSPPPQTLHAGEALVGAESAAARPRKIDVTTATAWTDGRIVFHETPLADALAEANRYSRVKLRLGEPQDLSAAKVSGSFNAGDTRALIDALGSLYALAPRQDPKGDIVLERRDVRPQMKVSGG